MLHHKSDIWMTAGEIHAAINPSYASKEVWMTVASHIAELKKKHEHLSEMVERAQRAPGIDDLEIADLKKQKLKIKEEIERLSHA
jgi:hypothetical protein